VARRTPWLKGLVAELQAARRALQIQIPPGHFLSPIPALDEVNRGADRLLGRWPRQLPGISLNEDKQLALLSELSAYYLDLPFPEHKTKDRRYFFENSKYSYSDAIFLYGMIRHLRPRRIVEVGSGHSSCVMLDTNELFFENRIACTFIDPHPERLLSLITPEDKNRIEIVPKRVQDVEFGRFQELEGNDILFIDCSHVVKMGSDANYIVSEVLPALGVGVYVHIHDIFYPFEYPREWIEEGWYFTEAYFVRAFLAFNSAFEIVLFNTFLERFHRERFAGQMPLCLKNEGGSIWIRRIA
jgi:hypothetical protein